MVGKFIFQTHHKHQVSLLYLIPDKAKIHF